LIYEIDLLAYRITYFVVSCLIMILYLLFNVNLMQYITGFYPTKKTRPILDTLVLSVNRKNDESFLTILDF
jgi:hypothetical protein